MLTRYSPKAEARFKDVGEAYAILSDPQKKYRYDSGADLDDAPGMAGHGGMDGVDPNDIFRMVRLLLISSFLWELVWIEWS